MKTSLKKLRGFALHNKQDSKGRTDPRPLAQWDELAQASQDLQDMRSCYDGLLSAAAATANSAYEFSESLRELGFCLLEKTALNDDDESGKVLLMLGKVQFELQKLMDSYRSHISQTITIPSESLLNELRTVEEMKRQCDEKRDVYEYMVTRQREKGRARFGKGESFTSLQLQAAREEYDEEATLFVFRLKSLKQGQSRSLLTQAARHHAAQLSFFKKALKSLEAVEPHVEVIAERQHIDYHFAGLRDYDGEEDESDDNDDDDDDDSFDNAEYGHDIHDDGELSFDYVQNDQDVISTSRNSMELDQVELTFPQVATIEAVKENLDKIRSDSFVYQRGSKICSQSAPLFADKRLDSSERIGPMQSSPRKKFHTYVLPTPVDTKKSAFGNSAIHTRQASITGLPQSMWHSSPLEPKKQEKIYGNEKFSGSTALNAPSVLRESNNNIVSAQLPPPLDERLSLSQLNQHTGYSKKIKRLAFSGPLTRSSKTLLSASGPIVSAEHPKLFSGPLMWSPVPQPLSSPKLSPSASPTFGSSPKISELHELPRPPVGLTQSAKPSVLIGHSAPLVSRGQVLTATNRYVVSNAASPLPTPPQTLSRSFSIPSSCQKMVVLHVSKPLEGPKNQDMVEDIASPPLTPISLLNTQVASTASEAVVSAGQIRGTD